MTPKIVVILTIVALFILTSVLKGRQRHLVNAHRQKPDYQWACKQGLSSQFDPRLACSDNDSDGVLQEKFDNWMGCKAGRTDSQFYYLEHGQDPDEDMYIRHEFPLQNAAEQVYNCNKIIGSREFVYNAEDFPAGF